jgi:hypothetical protein
LLLGFANVVGSNVSPASSPSFHSPYRTMYPASPPGAWVPFGDPSSYPTPVYSPNAVPVARFFKPGVVSPSYSGDSSGSASSSAPSSLPSDDVVFVTEDPKYAEHSHQHQSQIRIAEERPVVHIPPFYPSKNAHASASPVSPVDAPHSAHSSLHSSQILNSPVSPGHAPRLRSRSNSRYKASNYKSGFISFQYAVRAFTFNECSLSEIM